MAIKNNVTRFLDAQHVEYLAHELPAEKLGALEVAEILGIPPDQVFKTIVTTRDKGKPVLAVIPGPRTVDLKKLAACLEEKKMHLPSEGEAEKLTGLQAGGISPLALIHRGFQVVIDSKAESLPYILVSGGQRGLNIQLKVGDLLRLVKGRLGEISRGE